MSSEEQQRLIRNMDRIERMLKKCIEADRQLLKQQRAETRALREKFKRLYGSDNTTGIDGDEPKR